MLRREYSRCFLEDVERIVTFVLVGYNDEGKQIPPLDRNSFDKYAKQLQVKEAAK